MEQAYVTVLDNDVATVTVEAANQSKLFGEVRFNLTREGDPADPLTVSLDITQTGVLDNGDPLPDTAPFATGPSTATFEAGSSTTNVRLTATKDFSHGGQSFSMDRGLVIAALADSDDYITGDPASATTLVFERIGDFPFVYIDDAGTVMEGEDLVFTLHRTGDAETSLTAWLQMRVRKFASFIPYSYQEVTFEAGSHTTTFTVPTQDNELNDGNRWYRVNLVLSSIFDDGVAPHSFILGYQIGYQYPAIGEGWVRDDDIPTVWVTPGTGEYFEDPEGGGPQFTVHRDSYTSTWSYVFTSVRQLSFAGRRPYPTVSTPGPVYGRPQTALFGCYRVSQVSREILIRDLLDPWGARPPYSFCPTTAARTSWLTATHFPSTTSARLHRASSRCTTGSPASWSSRSRRRWRRARTPSSG